MVGNSARMGEYLLERIQLLRQHPIVGDVRGGMGLLCAIEIVKDRDTRERSPGSAKPAQRAVRIMRRHRMQGRAGDIIPVAPPLCITRDEVDESLARLDRVLTELGQEMRTPGE